MVLTTHIWVQSHSLGYCFLRPGLKQHLFVLQIFYKYLIIALGIQLDYEKVLFEIVPVSQWPTYAKIKHCIGLLCIYF